MINAMILGLFPKSEFSPSCPGSERAIYRRPKESLPSGWTAWHSLKIRSKGAEFSESDFLIAILKSEAGRYPVRMNIAVSRAYGR
jgi:hypothetical protein